MGGVRTNHLRDKSKSMEKLLGEFSFGLFIWQTFIVVGLLLLLRKFAWNPILNAIDDREEGIRSALQSAQDARAEMQNLQADNERILKAAIADLKQEVASLSIEIAEKVTKESLSEDKKQTQLVEKLLKDVNL